MLKLSHHLHYFSLVHKATLELMTCLTVGYQKAKFLSHNSKKQVARGSRGNDFLHDNLLRLWHQVQNLLVRESTLKSSAMNILTMEKVCVDVYSILSTEAYMQQHP